MYDKQGEENEINAYLITTNLLVKNSPRITYN